MKTIRTAPSVPQVLAISAANLPAARRRLLEWILANEAHRRIAAVGGNPPPKP